VADGAIEGGINHAVGERWRGLDPLLPVPGKVTGGCGQTFRTPGRAGFAVCQHVVNSGTSLATTWGARTQFVLSPRLAGPDVAGGLDNLLDQWRAHISKLAEAHGEDSTARISWPTRDTAGVRALLRHGMQPMMVIAARPAGRAIEEGGHGAPPVREAGPADLATVVRFEMELIRYDAEFGVVTVRPATEALVRQELVTALNRRPSWIWLAEDEKGRPLGSLVLAPPERASWIAPMTSMAPAAYLGTMFVQPGERGTGVGAALVRRAHAAIDDHDAAVTLLHHSQVNPLSGPFWSRMGYRPLWTNWQASPAAFLR
jgi:GNAT superfamily N-acetyltransferase